MSLHEPFPESVPPLVPTPSSAQVVNTRCSVWGCDEPGVYGGGACSSPWVKLCAYHSGREKR